jgi:excisionase family DNA binding protein
VNVSLDPQDLERIADAVVGRLGDGRQRTAWLTTREAAEHLRCSPRQLQKLVRLGDIAAYRPTGPTGHPLFNVTDLDLFVSQTKED